MSEIGRVCVVGAGPAGLTVARSLRARGVPCTVFERHSDVGGLWDQANAGSPVYDSAHFISSKGHSHFFDYPMPDAYPDYPSHDQILDYIRAFADTYGLRDDIVFGVGVKEATPADDGGWDVTLTTGEREHFAALVCANGTNWHPVMPEYPGTFAGEIRHSSTYRSMDEFRGTRVLIIGAGNSGCDIACDAAQAADVAAISMRRGYWFIPKHIFGIPADEFADSGPKLPLWLEQRIFGVMLRVLNGNPERLGLKKPDHKLFETHPILNTQILHFLQHGDITAKPDIERFDGNTVHFIDGSSADFDLVLCATGYDWQIPYVPRDAFVWKAGRPDLYLNVFSRENPNLYVAGFLETNGGAYGLFDETADLIARAIVARSEGGAMARRVDRLVATDRPDLTGGINLVDSDRHATYIDATAYRKALKHARKELGWPALVSGMYDTERVEPVGAS